MNGAPSESPGDAAFRELLPGPHPTVVEPPASGGRVETTTPLKWSRYARLAARYSTSVAISVGKRAGSRSMGRRSRPHPDPLPFSGRGLSSRRLSRLLPGTERAARSSVRK